LANSVWAFATAGVAAPQLFEAVAIEASRRIKEFNSQKLANTVWAFATAGVTAPQLFEAVAIEALRKIKKFNSQNLANTAWAFATSDVAAPQLFEAIARQAQIRINEFNPQAVANAAWAFATAGVAAPKLFEAIASEALRRVKEFKSQEVANTAWAFACVGWEQNHIFEEFGSAIAGDLDKFEDLELSQLYVVALHVHIESPDLDFPLLDRLELLRSAFTRCEPRPSRLQRDVSSMLREMGWSHEFEHVTSEGFSLDLAVPESKEAVEVDGPFHFLRDVSSGEFVINGATQFKKRLLRKLGWKVASVAFFEWNKKTRKERETLLMKNVRSEVDET